MKELKHYVERFYPGIIVSETSVEEIEDRIPTSIKLEEGCYGFRFFDKSIAVIDGETLIGERKNISGIYYPGGVVYSIDGVKKHHPEMETLIKNMERNSIDAVVKTKVGNWQQFHKEDNIIHA